MHYGAQPSNFKSTSRYSFRNALETDLIEMSTVKLIFRGSHSLTHSFRLWIFLLSDLFFTSVENVLWGVFSQWRDSWKSPPARN